MENQSNKWHVRLWKNAKHRLMKTSLEQLICFGVKSDLPQRQIMAVYAGYSLLGTLLLLMPISTKGDIPFMRVCQNAYPLFFYDKAPTFPSRGFVIT